MTDTAGQCPVPHGAPSASRTAPTNASWWPDRLNLKILAKNPVVANPQGADFDYRAAFETLDLAEVKADIARLLTESQPWWPADFGNYGPLMIRMAWHSAGTYRVFDGRGGGGTGQQRFAPLNSWPDNVGLDKARRLLWPVKKKYGRSLSWGDLMILAGNVAHEQMGMPVFGFAGGRPDVWEPDDDVYWGSESTWLGDEGRLGADGAQELSKPLGATMMGLIYVNPEGPRGSGDPIAAAHQIRETFGRMAMDDEETVALIAGGHTFGKTHGAAPEEGSVGESPEGAPMEQLGLGWKSSHGSGSGNDTIGSGIEVTWTYHPTRWDNEFFHILFAYEWELVTGEGGHTHWRPKDGAGSDMVPMAQGEGRREPRMLTTDISLREDPIYREISLRFKNDQEAFTEAYRRAWFKLTHRDLGPKSRYLGAEVPAEDLLWQDPIPAPTGPALGDADVADLARRIGELDLPAAELVRAAWAASSSFRGSDKRGGANGGRIRLEPQRSWEVNRPAQLARVLDALDAIKAEFDAQGGPTVSIADLVVLAGNVGVQQAARAAGHEVEIPFTPGRTDASQAQTDVESFGFLEPAADGFRNYESARTLGIPAEHLLLDRANLLTLSAPEMTVLLGGLRVIGTNWDDSQHGVLTDRPGALTNDFFVNLLDLDTQWRALDPQQRAFEGVDESSGERRWTGTRADLVFGSNSELRAIAEVYASDDAQTQFVRDFVDAWVKVSNLDRFDAR
ncbi:catalase/peroxidase HPI [Leucobacter sp. OLJS4]|uniref:catalase/peroxidase HPI n=1 Tax=unclassified Leucobacter TaxID=2621730 RepID=UPI000C175FA6|nr:MULTISPECIES: catalase/peroxidase HPI [unclassified Leucobacter]PII82513.1 catalase/peroxidase HPI [Leucobacter sp. OLCALW19]PII87304.1 catalase/peroxidase HPI [Leucobacter sp. OLTLW20]PII94640.1 catalase/peroxidase HPI [Leucobacter sp. OLAS13]PII97836.1 catalase/peroxidase HPI [Leucobacter sp. OLCS4]PIJ00562.1 catalase/peroxidase HPI [Leucobacter sp. OLDS2]